MTVPTRFYTVVALAALSLALAPGSASAIDPRFELDPRLLDKEAPAPARAKESRGSRKSARPSAGNSDYTIRPGDHIFRILMRDYGLSNDEAETPVPQGKR